MPHFALLTYYCVLILLASIAGGLIPHWFRLTHRRMELAVSFVAGVMLGVALLVMLPHAVDGAAAAGVVSAKSTMGWLLAGILAMFFIERFFCYHHHDAPADEDDDDLAHGHAHCGHSHDHDGEHVHHDITWGGAALGMTLHSILDGVALAASVQHGTDGVGLAGIGTFLVVLLHKPFDSMTISTLMARGNWTPAMRHLVNGLFALSIPLGVIIFYYGLLKDGAGSIDSSSIIVANALAFSAGTFLCIACSDLLPELQFHQHDRVKLSAALLLGLSVAMGISKLEASLHGAHSHGPGISAPIAAPQGTEQPE